MLQAFDMSRLCSLIVYGVKTEKTKHRSILDFIKQTISCGMLMIRYFFFQNAACTALVCYQYQGLEPVSISEIRLSVRPRKVSKPRDLYLELSDLYEIWQVLRQQCCRCTCQISKRYVNLKNQSRVETLRDLTKRRLLGYCDGAQVMNTMSHVASLMAFIKLFRHHIAWCVTYLLL